jgi:hypothetical protein
MVGDDSIADRMPQHLIAYFLLGAAASNLLGTALIFPKNRIRKTTYQTTSKPPLPTSTEPTEAVLKTRQKQPTSKYSRVEL